MVSSGYLNERVTIMSPTTNVADYGEQITTYDSVKDVWCAVSFQRGQRALMEHDVVLTRSVVFTMRNNPIITDRCRLVWDGKTYAIESFNRLRTDGTITIVASVLDEYE